jgi:hypothetical protein
MKNIKPNNSSGFAHLVTIVAFVVIFAIAGAGYVVATHADSTSSTASSSTTVSSATSGSSAKLPLGLACGLLNTNGVALTKGQIYKPTFTVNNYSKSTYKGGTFKTRVLLADDKFHLTSKSTKSIKIGSVGVRQSSKVYQFTNSYKAPLYDANKATLIVFAVYGPGASTQTPTCSAYLPLPRS